MSANPPSLEAFNKTLESLKVQLDQTGKKLEETQTRGFKQEIEIMNLSERVRQLELENKRLNQRKPHRRNFHSRG